MNADRRDLGGRRGRCRALCIVAFSALLSVAAPAAGQSVEVLQRFTTLSPFSTTAPLIEATDGNFYGTAGGGTSGLGGVFRLTPDGEMTVLHEFSGPDGATPVYGLVQARDGDLYGTTEQGGTFQRGTIFKITLEGSLTILHHFTGSPDGGSPSSQLVQARDGNLYGTTLDGGAYNRGALFRVTPTGLVTVLKDFFGSHGVTPQSALIQGADGRLYGVTGLGEDNSSKVFAITLDGVFSIVHDFRNEGDGVFVRSLRQAFDGSFYGTAGILGTGDGWVFRMSAWFGVVTILHRFSGGPDGGVPLASVIEGSDGNLYGIAQVGGIGGAGTVYQITPSGVLMTAYAFSGPDVTFPLTLFRAADGRFYGTTSVNGVNPPTVFRLFLPICNHRVRLTYRDGTLDLGFHLTSPTPGLWQVWLASWSTGIRQLWHLALPPVFPDYSFHVQLAPFPRSGAVGVLSSVTTEVGGFCRDWQVVDTDARH